MTSEERDGNQVAVATRFTFRPSEVLTKDLIPRSFPRGSFIFEGYVLKTKNGFLLCKDLNLSKFIDYLICSFCRGVAQFDRASRFKWRGWWFKSSHSDQNLVFRNGCNSVAEYYLAKIEVIGSIPVTRSKKLISSFFGAVVHRTFFENHQVLTHF